MLPESSRLDFLSLLNLWEERASPLLWTLMIVMLGISVGPEHENKEEKNDTGKTITFTSIMLRQFPLSSAGRFFPFPGLELEEYFCTQGQRSLYTRTPCLPRHSQRVKTKTKSHVYDVTSSSSFWSFSFFLRASIRPEDHTHLRGSWRFNFHGFIFIIYRPLRHFFGGLLVCRIMC